MTFRDPDDIDNDDKDPQYEQPGKEDPDYDKKYFSQIGRTEDEINKILADCYIEVAPVLINELNKFVTERKEYFSFHMMAKFMILLTIKTLDNNVRMHKENERPEVMARALSTICNFIQGYIMNMDLSGPRPQPKYFGFDPEDMK